MTIIVLLATLSVVITIRWKKAKTTTKQEQIYYSEVGPPSVSVKTKKDTFYEEISTLDEHYRKEDKHSRSLTKTSPQEFHDRFTETAGRRSSPVLDQNPAYGTSITAAITPDNIISTEKNRAYGCLEP